MRKIVPLVALGISLGMASFLSAQTNLKKPDVEDEAAKEARSKELNSLLNTPVGVASLKVISARETPGIVSVLDREEILRSGARDLMDVLRLVPGFDFGVDVQGVTGISLRGIWAHEGKVLLLWDGMEMNETLFGNVPLGQRFPVDQIERIEIIRGPGSSLYGGYAEVAVVQITTVKARSTGAGVLVGRGGGTALRTQASLVTGGSIGPIIWDVGAFGGEGQRSAGTFVDALGMERTMAKRSELRPGMFNLGIQGGGVQFRLLADQYMLESQDNLGQVLETPAPIRFSSVHADLRYTFFPSTFWSIQPYVTWKTQKPWWSSDPATGVLQLTTTDRTRLGLTTTFDPEGRWGFMAGLESIQDAATIRPPSNTPPLFLNGTDHVSYQTNSVFVQGQYTGPVNVTLGARYESSNATQSSFVPRLAFTKAGEDWHVKLLLAKAFRSPAIMNINLPFDPSTALQPEQTTSSELEFGHLVGSGLLTLALFDLKIDKPIVFTVSGASLGYSNQPRTGSRGFELDYRTRWASGFTNASWSHHQARNDVDAWAVPGHAESFLGTPEDKVVVAGGKTWGSWSLNPTAIWMGPRWGYAYQASAGGLALIHMPSDLLLQVNLAWDKDAWHYSLGVHDLLDRAPAFLQPYNGGHPPLPGPGREVVFKARYGF